MQKVLQIFLTLLLFLPALAQTPALTEVTSVEGITEYRLSNGLEVLLFPDPSSNKTTVNITYLVGSRHEGYGETGMAHLLEHLLFKGSSRHKNIPQELTEHGASPNGTTWYDRTNYYETFPASDENLAWALDLEADRMVNSFVARKDLDSEMTVVRNEFESGENNPTGILMQRTMSAAFLWHNYGNSTIGARADIENVPIGRLQAFYRKYYQPDNAVLVVAGKFNPELARRLIVEKFGAIPKPERKLIRTYTAEPTQDGERRITLRRVGEVQALTSVYHIPSGSHQDFAAVDILGEVLADSPSGRLYKSMVETKLVTGVYGGAFQLREPGLLIFIAKLLKDGPLNEAEAALVSTVEEFANTPPTQEEVDRARTSLLKSMEATLRDSQRLSLQLSEWAAMGDWRLFFLHRDRLEKVTPEQVLAVAQKYLKASNRTLGVFIPTAKPERAEIEAAPDPKELLAGYKGRPPVAQGEKFDPSFENLDARTERFELRPGLKVAFLPKKTRGESVQLKMTFHIGNLDSLRGLDMVASLTGNMLMRGTTSMTRAQIKDKLDQLRASGGVSSGASSIDASFETTRENLPALLPLVADIIKNPSFPNNEFETLMASKKARLDDSKSDPQDLAALRLRRHLQVYKKGDPRYNPTLEETEQALTSVKLGQLKDFHQRFFSLTQGEIAVVGDFEPDQIRELLKTHFDGLSSDIAYQRMVSETAPKTPINESISVPDKANALFLAARNLQLTVDHPDAPALKLGNYILGGGFLNSRLATRIRQKDGLSYGVGSSVRLGRLDKVGRFTIYAIAAPQNIEKVEAAVADELGKVVKDGFTQKEFEAARKGYLESLKVRRGRDSTLAGMLLNDLYYGDDFSRDKAWEEKIEKLTLSDLNRVASEYFQVAPISVVKGGSF